MFGSNGNYVNTFGAEGQGPGEFSRITWCMDIDRQGNLYIADIGNSSIHIYRNSGQYHDSIKLNNDSRCRKFTVLPDGNIAALMQPGLQKLKYGN